MLNSITISLKKTRTLTDICVDKNVSFPYDRPKRSKCTIFHLLAKVPKRDSKRASPSIMGVPFSRILVWLDEESEWT